MITITKPGDPAKVNPAHKASCSRCGGEFTYQNEDIQPDSRDGNYVICPTAGCGQFIAVGHHQGYRSIFEDH